MQNVLLLICLLLLVSCVALAIIWRSLLKSVIALAVASVLLAIILFLLGLPVAALFQLAVGAWLITVVLIGTISLTGNKQSAEEQALKQGKRFALWPFLLIVGGAAIVLVVLFSNVQLELNLTATAGLDQFRDLFWHTRQVDILGQIILVLASALVVTVFFKKQSEPEPRLIEDDSVGTIHESSADA